MSIFNSNEAELAAANARATKDAARRAQAYLDLHYHGQDAGACGFAWVDYYPEHKGNTKLGKLERKLVEGIGFRKNYTGKVWQKWNPADARCQNVEAKYYGARQYAETLLAQTGVKVYAGDRLD